MKQEAAETQDQRGGRRPVKPQQGAAQPQAHQRRHQRQQDQIEEERSYRDMLKIVGAERQDPDLRRQRHRQ